jgi:hypothetical protein
VRARYDLQEIGHPDLRDVLAPFLQRVEAGRRRFAAAG